MAARGACSSPRSIARPARPGPGRRVSTAGEYGALSAPARRAAHNQLYRSRRFNFSGWGRELFQTIPRRLFRDNYFRLSFVVFWVLFLASMLFAHQSREFAERLVGRDQLRPIQDMYSQPLDRQNGQVSAFMQSFYSNHNSTIGLRCFAFGLLFGVGGLVEFVFNAIQIGGIFGFMTTVSQWGTFSNFVTAHGPFELTAVVLSAAAGMRLGFSIIITRGLSRGESLRQAGREAMPTMGLAVALFSGRADRGLSIPFARSLSGQGRRGDRLGGGDCLLYRGSWKSAVGGRLGGSKPCSLTTRESRSASGDLADVLDLSLQVIRAYALPWLIASVIGAVPLGLLNWWLLKSKWLPGAPQNGATYLCWMLVLVAFELPLASAALTRYIGHAVFVDRPPVRQIVRDLFDSLPQLFFFQIVLRGFLFLPALLLGDAWWWLWGADFLVDAVCPVSLLERSDPARAQSARADPRTDDDLAAEPGPARRVARQSVRPLARVAGHCRGVDGGVRTLDMVRRRPVHTPLGVRRCRCISFTCRRRCGLSPAFSRSPGT